MDDILLLAENKQTLQLMMDTTNDFLWKWNLKVNKGKSAIMKFRSNKYNNNFMIGNKIIEISQSYKYFKDVLTADLNLEDIYKKRKKQQTE